MHSAVPVSSGLNNHKYYNTPFISEQRGDETKKMKVYHMGSRGNMDDFQFIVVASDDSEGINNIKDWYAQITVWKKQKQFSYLFLKSGLSDKSEKRAPLNDNVYKCAVPL